METRNVSYKTSAVDERGNATSLAIAKRGASS
jgi:hypothetical protein